MSSGKSVTVGEQGQTVQNPEHRVDVGVRE
jgi:hypothetical protein